ncbi:unnamed protein product [Cochlearia groenlandica]
MKKTSSRSQRGNKGIKGKHVLQICVLLGVCIWLIYQVKYSHDKKKEFYEKDGEKTTVLVKEDGLVKLGRKDLLPGYHNTEKEIENKHVEEDDDEEEEKESSKSKVEEDEKEVEEDEVVEEDEEEKSKQVEEVAEEEDEEDKSKQGEEDGEEDKHEEDEIDEQDQSKNGEETDKDDELLLSEEEKEESGLRESDENVKDTNRADEIDMTVDEAREEHYKADDASSAVSHESRVLNTQKLKESFENSTETAHDNHSNVTTSNVEVRTEPELKLGEAESHETPTEVKDGNTETSISETKSAVTESIGETVHHNSTEAVLEASGFLKNETEIMRERSQEHDKAEEGAPPSGLSASQAVFKAEQTRNESEANTTDPVTISDKSLIQDESKNSTSESSSLIKNISGSNTTAVVEENSRSEGDDENESSNLSSTEEVDDTSILQEEREALTDPQTLPDIRIGSNEEDEEEAMAAE